MEKSALTVLIPIAGIIMGCGIGMLELYFKYLRRKEMFALHHAERMAAIDKGLELPPLSDSFFTDDGKPRKTPRHHLLFGMILVFVGLILSAAFMIRGNAEKAVFALTLAGTGLAFLIYYFAVGKKQAEIFEAAQLAKLAEDAKRSRSA